MERNAPSLCAKLPAKRQARRPVISQPPATARNKFVIDGEIVRISLTQGQTAVVDLVDWPAVSQYRWCADKRKYTFYAKADGGKTRLHKLLAPGKEIDHKDGDGLNNRRSNLRDVSGSQNQANRRVSSNNKTGFKGVRKNIRDGRFRARIKIHGNRLSLGTYETPEQAAHAYDTAAKELHGEFARLNFPNETKEGRGANSSNA